MFYDRIEAGIALAAKLKKYANDPGIVLAVPRGGVPVGYAVAKELGFPVEVVLTKKIGHPNNKEYAIGAASLTGYFIEPHKDVSEEYLKYELESVRAKLEAMYAKFMNGKEPTNLASKTVLVVDDGIATGNTLLATIKVIRQSNPAKIVVAVPVAPIEAVNKLAKEADDVVVVLIPEFFYGVGAFYENFQQVSDEEVLYYLNKLNELRKAG